MTKKLSMRTLLEELSEDTHRKVEPFSPDIEFANKVILNPYTRPAEMEEVINLWVQRHQPCIFGQVAAAMNRMHYCVLTERDLTKSDNHVRNKIRLERALWKQRALNGNSNTRHGFMLLVASPRLALAAPDAALKNIALRIRDLWGCLVESDEHGNDVAWEHLFLRAPDGAFYKFTFSVDFFAAAADGTWWHDHRCPAGIGFTANSLGHMLRTREWYEKKSDQIEWGLKVAMMTIAAAHETKFGAATKLRELDQHNLPQSACPFSAKTKLPQDLRSKDWTTYEGVLHTDHSVRDEFFAAGDRPSTRKSPWLMDFTYIYDKTRTDYVKFMAGQLVSQEEVFGEIGKPTEWRLLGGSTKTTGVRRPKSADREIADCLALCRQWKMSDTDLISATSLVESASSLE